MFSRILAPTDGSPRSNRALAVAARLAHSTGAVLTLFHAVRSESPFGDPMSFNPAKLRARARSLAKRYQLAVEVVHTRSDTPAQAIVAAAGNCGANVIVMACRGHKGIESLLVGSETQRVLARAQIPVLLV